MSNNTTTTPVNFETLFASLVEVRHTAYELQLERAVTVRVFLTHNDDDIVTASAWCWMDGKAPNKEVGEFYGFCDREIVYAITCDALNGRWGIDGTDVTDAIDVLPQRPRCECE